jgi:hypothetical protein
MECVYSVCTVNRMTKYPICACWQGLITRYALKRKKNCLFCGMNKLCLQCVHCKFNDKVPYRRQLAGVDYEMCLEKKDKVLFEVHSVKLNNLILNVKLTIMN